MKEKNYELTMEMIYQEVSATNEELCAMYVKGTNKYAPTEMRNRGLY